jgi:transcription antitermination factor NusG
MVEADNRFQIGDRVRVRDQSSVFRGDVGTITQIDPVARQLTFEVVVFGRSVPLELDFSTASVFLEPVDND